MNIERIRSLIDLFATAPLTELTLEENGARLHLRRGSDNGASAVRVIEPVTQVATPATAVEPAAAGAVEVSAMLPGTVYLCPSPDEAPFVSEGSMVKGGETIAIIEAMKSMNSVVSPVTGTVVRIPVANEDAVSEGQVLLEILPEREDAAK